MPNKHTLGELLDLAPLDLVTPYCYNHNKPVMVGWKAAHPLIIVKGIWLKSTKYPPQVPQTPTNIPPPLPKQKCNIIIIEFINDWFEQYITNLPPSTLCITDWCLIVMMYSH